MPKDMIGSITRALVGVPLHRQGVLLGVVQRLSNTSSDGDGWCSCFDAVIKKGLPQKETILESVGTVVVPATTGRFVAAENFVVDTGRKAKVKISYLGDNFKEWFGDKVEDQIAKQELRYAKLRKSSVDNPIIVELGGETKVETTLSEIYSLMAKQRSGENGALLNNGWANIFYIKDHAGVLRAVYVRWGGGGWRVYAGSVAYPREWSVGYLVFSRNS